jgi:deoxyhypusine synthase
VPRTPANNSAILIMVQQTSGPVSAFLRHHYRHFNAAALIDAADGYTRHLDGGGKMLVSLAGAMSTAELGLSLAEMIRQDKVHAISCTGANLEEDIYNLVAHDHYERVPNYRDLTPEDEQVLLEKHMNRVTDTCIPEGEAIRRIEKAILEEWHAADQAGERYFPHEFMYRILLSGKLEQYYQIDPKNSWMLAAAEKNLPMIVPGWEDSTTGNIFAAHCIEGDVKNVHTVRTGIEYMTYLADYYTKATKDSSIGFFQIGGGIAGDFPICVVPMLHQDLQRTEVPLWGYFAQISDSTTSYGSYSGAVPNEKITWGKLGIETPKYIIESDASIVAPLVFALVLGQ